MMSYELKQLHLVLFFTTGTSLQTWQRGGNLERELALYRSLLPRIRRLTLVTYGGPADLEISEELHGFEVICNRHRLPRWLYTRIVLPLIARSWRPPLIVKSNQTRGAEVCLRIARQKKCASIARCGYLYSDHQAREWGEDSPEAGAATLLEKHVFQDAKQVVVTAPFMRELSASRHHIPDEKIAVIPNFVETDRFCPAEELGPGSKLSCVAKFAPQKNLFALLEAIEGLDVELLLAGAGPQEGALKRVAAEKNLKVRFFGNISSGGLPDLLRSSGMFVLPSHYEGHPKALIEAMGCGLPVVAANVVGIREVIEHGVNGLLCGTSAMEIRETIKALAADSSLRARIGSAARDTVESEYALDKVLEEEVSLMISLLTEERRCE